MKENDPIPTLAPTWGADVFPLLSWFKQERLARATVLALGCGALATDVLTTLALFGVGHLVVVDFDTIEPSNLTRSILFSQADAEARRPKATVTAKRIREINPSIQVLPLECDICHDIGLGLLRQMDVVVGCVDNRWARYCLNRLCMRVGVPWVDGGIDGLEGTARVFMPGKNCYACNLGPEALKDMSYRLSCSASIQRNEQANRVPTTPVIASIIGAVEAQEAIKLLHPDELASGELTSLCGKMFYYEGQHLAARIAGFTGYDEECPVHEQWEPIEKADLTTDSPIGEALDNLAGQLGCNDVEIILRDHCFVDYLTIRKDDREVTVMLPDYAIAQFLEEEPTLRHLPFHAFYQHEIKAIDSHFPYRDLTLSQIGIPPGSILHVRTENGNRYVELADERNYSTFLFQSRQV